MINQQELYTKCGGWARIAIYGMMERAPVRIPQSKTLINTDENTNPKTPINETKNDKFDSNFKLNPVLKK